MNQPLPAPPYEEFLMIEADRLLDWTYEALEPEEDSDESE